MKIRETVNNKIPIAISNRHVHLCKQDLNMLFGEGYTLTKMKDLSQPGQFAAQETVTLAGSKGRVKTGVRILGPERSKTQVEISRTDGFELDIMPPVRDSGDLAGSPGIVIVGPKGAITLKEGVICAWRHIHMNPEDALHFGVTDKQYVKIK
ncbi:MAG TPA: phosphate propanoyltransferase, partial [Candidatus Eremiobacteraeota bacterium]|nr:phosphate propanoyltransferase [Candidatus Eremiobacteraeota bacterium]